MAEREIGGHAYKTGKLDARRQFHVGRRLAPVLGLIMGSLRPGADGKFGGDALASSLMAAVGPMSQALAAMPDDDVDYIISACLSVCERQMPGGAGWGPVQTPQGQLMHQDIEMPQMLQLVTAAIQENLGGFFAAFPSMLGQGTSPGA